MFGVIYFLENFIKSTLSLQKAHAYNREEAGDFMRFMDLLELVEELHVESHCLRERIPCRCVVVGPVGFGNNFIFS